MRPPPICLLLVYLHTISQLMKRTLLILSLLLCSLICGAQEATTPLTFKGLPVEGNYQSFAQKLIQKGFKQIGATEEGIVLSGTFMTYSETMVIVCPASNSDIVSLIIATIDAGNKWADIENRYHNVVSVYKEKYGDPFRFIEDFSGADLSLDFLKLHALQEGTCRYRSEWHLNGGTIAVYLQYLNGSYYVGCAYEDELYDKAMKKAMIDDI